VKQIYLPVPHPDPYFSSVRDLYGVGTPVVKHGRTILPEFRLFRISMSCWPVLALPVASAFEGFKKKTSPNSVQKLVLVDI
jgi:hypothetical protein